MENLLRELEKDGWIKKQKIALAQIQKLSRRALKDLNTAEKNLHEDPECAYDYSYKAMLRIGRAILYIYGYRPRSERSHKTVVETCRLLLGNKFEDMVNIFDRMRKIRNQFTYDPVSEITRKEAAEALKEAGRFLKTVAKRIKEVNPQLSLF